MYEISTYLLVYLSNGSFPGSVVCEGLDFGEGREKEQMHEGGTSAFSLAWNTSAGLRRVVGYTTPSLFKFREQAVTT